MSLDQSKADWREEYRERRVNLKVQHPRIYWFCVALGGLYLVLLVSHLIANWITD